MLPQVRGFSKVTGILDSLLLLKQSLNVTSFPMFSSQGLSEARGLSDYFHLCLRFLPSLQFPLFCHSETPSQPPPLRHAEPVALGDEPSSCLKQLSVFILTHEQVPEASTQRCGNSSVLQKTHRLSCWGQTLTSQSDSETAVDTAFPGRLTAKLLFNSHVGAVFLHPWWAPPADPQGSASGPGPAPTEV